MSIPPSNNDPRVDQAAVTDESLLTAHEKILTEKKDDKANYALGPLALLFIFSGLIFFAGTYLNKYSGHFHPTVFNEETPEHYGPGGGAAAAPVDPIEAGKKIYNNPQYCVSCHQPTGLGVPGTIPPLAASDWAQSSEEHVIRIVLHGLQGPLKVNGKDFGVAPMPPFGAALNDEKIAQVLTYVRQEWGNKAGPITAAKVAEIRAKEGAHAPWAPADLEKLP